jgi:hypothetical protein
MEEITIITKAIETWNADRQNATTAKQLLKQGTFFSISRKSYDKWNENQRKPEYVYAYLGDFEGELKFVLIDSESAKKPLDKTTLPFTFVEDLRRDYNVNKLDFVSSSTRGNVDVDDALKSTLRWSIMLDSYIDATTSDLQNTNNGLVKVFIVPYSSLDNSFANSEVDELIAVLSLTPNDNPEVSDLNYLADLILWATSASKGDGDLKVQDLVKPCPPFCDLPTWP